MRNYKLERLQNNEAFITSEKGNSMVPLIKSGQQHRLIPIKWEDCIEGDIVYCKVKGNFYTHLVKAKNEEEVSVCYVFHIFLIIYKDSKLFSNKKLYLCFIMKGENKTDWKLNIDEFYINKKVKDKFGGISIITDKTSNSIEVFIKKKNKEGINHKQWFTMRDFNDRFKSLDDKTENVVNKRLGF